MRSTGSVTSQQMDRESVAMILSQIEANQANLLAAEDKLVFLQQLQSILKLTEEFLVQASDPKELSYASAFNLRGSKHPLPGSERFTFQEGDHDNRLNDLDIDTSEVPDDYICPILMTVITDPVLLETTKASITKAYEHRAIASQSKNPTTRANLTLEEKTTISKAYKNIISAFVRVQEIKQYLIAREKTRRAQLALLPDCKEKAKILLTNTEFLQQCGLALDQVPERYLSPQFQQGEGQSARTVFTYPVMVETAPQDKNGVHHDAKKITVCFLELLKYQDNFHQVSDTEKAELLAIHQRSLFKSLEDQKKLQLLRVNHLHREDEVSLEYNIFCVMTDYKIKRDAVNQLTYDDIRKSDLLEFINPFTRQPLESIEMDYKLMHELDMFLMNCHFEQLEHLRNEQIKLARALGDCGKLHHPIRLIEEEILSMNANMSLLNSKLETALINAALRNVKHIVSHYNEKAKLGDIRDYIHQGNYVKYMHPGKSYAQVLAEAAIEIPAHLPLGLIPNNNYKVEFMTHPVRLDGEHVIDFDTLMTFWKEKPAFLGLFGGRKDLTGINPFTDKPIKSITYDHKLKAEIDRFMMDKGFFEKVKTLTVKAPDNSSFGFSSQRLQKLIEAEKRNKELSAIAKKF